MRITRVSAYNPTHKTLRKLSTSSRRQRYLKFPHKNARVPFNTHKDAVSIRDLKNLEKIKPTQNYDHKIVKNNNHSPL